MMAVVAQNLTRADVRVATIAQALGRPEGIRIVVAVLLVVLVTFQMADIGRLTMRV